MRVRIETCAATVFLTFAPCAAQEADTASQLVKALGSADAAEGIRARQRLLKLRKAAVPALLKGLKTAKPGSDHANNMLKVLGSLGTDATEALPELLKLLLEKASPPDLVIGAVDRIAPFVPDQNEAVVNALANVWMQRNRGQRSRRMSTSVIARSKTRLDVHSDQSLSKLIEFIEEGHSVHREVAAELIVTAAGDKQKKLTALKNCLGRKGGRERIRVQFRTATMSASISTSVDNHAKEQLAVARAIVLLSPTKDVPSEAWIVLLGHEDPNLVRRAIHAVGASPSRAAVPKLLRLTRSPDRNLAWEGVTALGMMGAHAEAAIPTLEQLSRDETDKATAARAKAALGAIRRAMKKKTGSSDGSDHLSVNAES